MSDPDQIHQILVNLCVNAGYAIGDKCGVLTVNLGLDEVDAKRASNMGVQKGTYVKLEVTDSGCGMTSDVMERIFDPFFTTKPVDKGSGMGLAVVHGIVTSHNGMTVVNSTPGKGTTFNVFFPMIKSRPELDMKDEVKSAPVGDECILFVDDEESIARLNQKGLERMGYKVTTRTNSIEALKTFCAQPDKFDIVITDQTMPSMSGDILARKILHIRPEIPIILCSGFNHIMDREEVRKIGISGRIIKPIGAAILR